ncbi:Unknown protein [Striga hermonthica]|uniref:Uncharacterized protein n=1 Tax=Striga hermonthica TaxID=68872 RepID=A0A9N7P4C5_STRHE|nr:Unknown protein [Striga hermonthica]
MNPCSPLHQTRTEQTEPLSRQSQSLVPKSVWRRFMKPEMKEEDNIQRLYREKAEQGQTGKQKDEEEKMMGRLLRHYNKKNGSSSVAADEKGKSVKPHSTNRVDSKKHSRTFSLDNNNAPDYDDFVARLAELRKNRGN